MFNIQLNYIYKYLKTKETVASIVKKKKTAIMLKLCKILLQKFQCIINCKFDKMIKSIEKMKTEKTEKINAKSNNFQYMNVMRFYMLDFYFINQLWLEILSEKRVSLIMMMFC